MRTADAPSMATVQRALSFLQALLSLLGRQWEARPANRTEVVVGEEEPVMAMAEVHGNGRSSANGQQPRPSVSPDEILSKARSRASKLEAAIQVLDGEDPALAGLQEVVEGQDSSESTFSRRPGCVHRALHHPREEEIRRCRSQSGRCHYGPRQVG